MTGIDRSRLPDTGVTIFTRMSALAQQTGAINLSQGFPDFSVDPLLIDRVLVHMREGRNQYAPMQGVPLLRERIAEKVERLYGRRYDPNTEITVTSGATEAVFCAITACLQPADQAIVIEPAYDAYIPAITLSHAVAVPSPMRFPGYRIDWDHVRDSICEKTRLIILNSPHNPTGTILDRSDIDALRQIVADTRILIVSDEVYEHIVLDGRMHESMCRYPDLAERSFVISSFGKTYHATGWKIGYCLAPEALSAEFQKIHQFVTFSSNTPVQYALADMLEKPSAYLELGNFYQRKRDFFRSRIADSRFIPLPCEGTYFQMLDYSRISDEPDTDFAVRMTREFGVAAIPPSVFHSDRQDHRVLRFCFAKNEHTLEEAAARLCRI
uniref:Aminotransferase class I/II-fold pyridoxal phosphate-dependent enzyme n=1 Tax=Desulfatirhabdium butyrativorans TaxID=340467 RepID=A0A7C4RSR2_9BACT